MTLKEIRENLKMSQQDVAVAVGMALNSYARLELGKSSVSRMEFERALKLAKVLQITPEELLEFSK